MREVIKLVVLFCVYVLVCFEVYEAVFIDKPVDAVVLQGSPAYFNCSTNSTSVWNNSIYIAWYNSTDTSCSYNPFQCTVYYSDKQFPNKTLSSRYQVSSVDSTNGVHIRKLEIISTISTDAGQYVCYDLNTETFATAQLVIIAGQPRCSTATAMPTSPNDTVSRLCQVDIVGSTNLGVSLIQGGKTISIGNSSTVTWSGLAINVITDNVTCVAPAGISSVQCPTIQVKPGNIAVNNVKSEFFVNDVLNCSAVGSSPLSYQWTTNTTSPIAPGPVLVVNKKNMAGPVMFQCTVTNNYGNTQTSIEAVVTVPVTGITISSQDTVHYVGDVITCDAAGYPLPNYTWSDVNNSSIRVSGPVFDITSSMIGINFTLMCTATNVVNGSLRNINSALMSFIVVGGLASSSLNTSSSKTTAIIAGVVCGVGGVAIIILVVLLVLFCRRRKYNGRSSDSSHPAKKAKAKVDTSATPNAAPQPLYAEVDKTRGANITTSSATTPPIYAHVGEGHEHIELSPMDTTHVNGSTGQYAEVGLEDGAAQNGVNFTINDSNEAYGYAVVTAGHLTRTRPTEPVAVVAENHYAAIDHTLKNVL